MAEEVDSKCAIVATLKTAIKDLLYNIIYHIVQEVVPREAEEEVLKDKYNTLFFNAENRLTRMVGTT
jgi:hypothetical protein